MVFCSSGDLGPHTSQNAAVRHALGHAQLLMSVFTDVMDKPSEKQCTMQLFLAGSEIHLETLLPRCSKLDQVFQIQINYQILCVDKQTLQCLCFNLTKEILAYYS